MLRAEVGCRRCNAHTGCADVGVVLNDARAREKPNRGKLRGFTQAGSGASGVLIREGIVGPLRHICDNSSTMGPGAGHGGHSGVEREVRDTARKALEGIEIGVVEFEE